MASVLNEILPPAKKSSATVVFYDHSSDPWFKQRYRDDIVKNKTQDFGDGTEHHYAPYPLDMGRKKGTLPVAVDDRGNISFNAIVKQDENSKRIVYSQHRDLIPKILKDDQEELHEDYDDDEEKQREIEKTTQQTKALINLMLQPKNRQTQSQDSKFINYKPSTAFDSGAKERIIRMVEMVVDPTEHPKFKHKRIPKAKGSAPVPVMHSPPRPLTVQDQKDWKIPPCVSNWKNAKGYTIPLDKRLAADGRWLQKVQINDHFAQLSEALYVAEQHAREAVSMRSKVQKELMVKGKQRKEQELRAVAKKARSERTGPTVANGLGSCDVSLMEGKKRKITRDQDGDPFGLDQFISQVKGGKKPLL